MDLPLRIKPLKSALVGASTTPMCPVLTPCVINITCVLSSSCAVILVFVVAQSESQNVTDR